MKKLISIILSVLMILSSFSVMSLVSAKETNVSSTGESYSGTTGDCKWSLDSNTGTLTISGDGKMASDTSTPWENYSDYITKVVIGNGVTFIGDYAFYNSKNLKSVTISDSVTTIGDYAFYDCSSLTSITIPNSVTSIGWGAFYGCSSLTSIEIPDSVTSIGGDSFDDTGYYNDENNWDNGLLYINNYLINAKRDIENCSFKDGTKIIANSAFYRCSSLTSITIPDSVTSIGSSAFKNCSSLTSITIPDSVTSIGSGVFIGCSSLTSITIPNSVTSIDGSAFRGCSSLTSIEIPDSVTSIGSSAFENCSSIKDVYYSGNKRQWKLINIGYDNSALYSSTIHYGSTTDSGTVGDCTWTIDEDTGILNISENGAIPDYTSSTYQNIPWYVYKDSIKTVNIESGVTSIGNYAFYNCSNIKDIYYSGNKRQWKLINIGYDNSTLYSSTIHYGSTTDSGTVGDCTWTIDEGTGVLNIFGNGDMPSDSYARDIPWYVYDDSIKTVNIESGVTSIGRCAFDDCSSLTSITIPNSVTSIGGYAFEGCSSLTSITIPDSVTSIGFRAFYDCSSLTSITIPNSVTSIDGSAFRGCSSLTSIEIPDSVTSIGSSAFENCSSLTSIEIPDSVTSIGYEAFKNTAYYNNENNWDNGLLYINNYLVNAKDGIENYSIKYGTKIIVVGAFYRCSSLTSINIPDSVTSIGNYAFGYCSSLTSITIPDSVTSIGDDAFEGCSSLTSITIPDSVTSIGSSAFENCSSLTSITIPDSVTSIGSSAFENCSSIKDVYYSGNKRQWKLANKNNDDDLKNATIHYGSTTDSGTVGDCTWTIDEDTGILNISENGAIPDYTSSTYQNIPWYVYKDSIKTVNIESGVTSIGNYAFYNYSNLTSITIPNSVTSIGNYAFYNCSNIKDIYYSGNKRQWKLINIGYDNSALYSSTIHYGSTTDSGTVGDCTWTIDEGTGVLNISGNGAIPDYDSSTYKNIPWYVYKDSIKTVNIESGVTSIGTYVFYNYSNLTSITIPDSATSIGKCAFEDCTSLTSISISDSLTSVGWCAFYNCSKLKDVYYSGNKRQWQLIKIENNNGALEKEATIHYGLTTDSGTVGDCTWAIDEDAGILNISGKGDMPSYIYTSDIPWYVYRESITKVNIEDGVTSIGKRDFCYYSNLTSITIPDSVKSIGSYAFNSTSKLSDIYYSGNYSSWKNISIDSSNSALNKATLHCGLVKDSGTIGGCTWSIDGDTGILNISGNGDMPSYSDTDDIPWYVYRESITKVNIEDGVTSIGMGDFYNCPNLTNVSIPDSVKTIGKNSFAYCSNLVDISLPDNLECIVEGAFYDTGYYKDENNWKNGVLYIGKYLIVANNVGKNCIIKDGTRLIANSAFAVQRNLARIAMPDTLEIIGESAFSDCTNLAGVSIPNSVKVIGTMAFNNCTGLANVTLSNSVNIINKNTFSQCTGLESIVIPSNVETIGEEAFSGCSGLTGVAISEGVKNIGKSAFKSCSIKNLTIPSSMETIGESAFASNILVNVVILEGITSINNSVFYQCTSLESIDIPVSVKSIGESAFAACRSLSTVNYFGNKKQWSLITVEKNNDKLKDANIQYGLLTDSGETGDCQWAFDGETGTMTITGNGKMEDYEDSANVPWILYASDIKTVIIDDGVTKIGDFSFADNCKNITDVTIANTVTDIGLWAFDGCDSIENVYYKGLENQWNTVKIRDYNDSIVNANIHFADEHVTEPTTVSTTETTTSTVTETEPTTVSTTEPTTVTTSTTVPEKKNFVVSSLLLNVVTDNNINKIVEGSQYTATLTPEDGFKIDSVKVQMGGKEVTVPYKDDKCTINIPNVDGDISIIAVAVKKIEPTTEPTTSTTEPTTVTTSTVTETEPTTVSTTEPTTSTVTETEPTTVSTTEPTTSTTESTTVNTTPSTVPTTTQPTTTKPTVKKVVKVSLRKKSVVLVKGRSTTVKATVTPTNATNKKLKWTTSNSKVAVVNSQGKITAKGRGVATIKVMALDGSNKYATIKVTVKQPVTSVKLNKKTATLKVKGNTKQKTVTLKATVYPKNANNKAVSWKSSNSKIATVNSKGKVTAKKKGTCYIIVTAKDGSKKSAKCKIVVK